MATRLALFDDSELAMDEVARALEAAGLKVRQHGDELAVQAPARLSLTLEQANWVREESAEMAEGHADAERIGRCGTRLVLAWDDADQAAVDELMPALEAALRTRLSPLWLYDPRAKLFV